jgi:hypothetical protein
MTNPIASVAALFHNREPVAFLGTCFPFREPTCFLTAAHCIGALPASELVVGLPINFEMGPLPVLSAERHPKADIALLRIAHAPDGQVSPFWNHASNYTYGEAFAAFGYPEDTFGPQPGVPVARLFRGHIQRVLHYASPLGYEYDSAELSIGSPAGLSGGPVFRPDAPVVVIGLVTENLQSTTYLEAIEEVQENGAVYRREYQSVINYGMAVLLDRVGDWLDERVPMTTTSIPRGSGILG